MAEQELELLEGTVSAVIFQNEENGYTILRLDVRGEEVTVVGPMAGWPRGSTCPSGAGGPGTPATAPS